MTPKTVKKLASKRSNDYDGEYFIWQSDSGHFFLDLSTRSVGKTVGVFDTLEAAKAKMEEVSK